jgi:hypothetical protein
VLLLKPGRDNLSEIFRKANAGSAFSVKELDFLVPRYQPRIPPPFESLLILKLKISQFLATKVFIDTDRLIPALYTACIADSRISIIGDELLKISTVDLENKGIVKALFAVYTQLGPRYQIRILTLLENSKLSTTIVAEISKAVELSLLPKMPAGLIQAAAPSRTPTSLTPEQSELHRALFKYLR